MMNGAVSSLILGWARVVKAIARWRFAVVVVVSSFGVTATGQILSPGFPWLYRLIEGSQLTDDCPVCDRVTIAVPMRGSFQLRLVAQNPLFSNYALEDIAFVAGTTNGPHYRVWGQGSYQIGGEVAVVEELFLDLMIENGFVTNHCYLTNTTRVTADWPMFRLSATQTNGTLTQQFYLDINAAPFREIWFSTMKSFPAGVWNPPSNSVSGGDLLSSAGRLVKANGQLVGRLGIMPSVPDLGLKDVDVRTRGEIVFSIEQEIFSETLGALHSGDLLSDQGRVVRTNPQLLAALAPVPALPDGAGLSAVQVLDDGKIYFSTQTNFFSGTLNRLVLPGDLLSDAGELIKAGTNLLANFHPANATNDYGLAAVHVWPSGEIWFSTREGFYDSISNYYGAGDLFSDRGYIVYRNMELLAAFQPPTNAAGYGLDGLFIVSDATPLNPSASTTTLGLPRFTSQPPSGVLLQWNGGGRIFQVEKAADAGGPFVPVSPIIPDLFFLDSSPANPEVQAFYRLHQW